MEAVPLTVTVTKPYRGGTAEHVERFIAVGKTVDDRLVLGLCVDGCPDYVGHMAYELSADLIRAMWTPRGGSWWFDAGSTCPEIKASEVDLRQALMRLGLGVASAAVSD